MNIPSKIPYFYNALYDLADQLDSYVLINQNNYNSETVELLARYSPKIRKMYYDIQAVYGLFAGTISEEEFLTHEP